MGRGIVKIHDDAYVEWSSVVDAPVSVTRTFAEACEIYGAERAARARASGTSFRDSEPDDSPASFNRAGPGELRLSVQEIATHYAPGGGADRDDDKAMRHTFESAASSKEALAVRKAMSLNFDVTLPRDPFAFLADVEKEAGARLEGVAPRLQRLTEAQDSTKSTGCSPFRHTTEAFLAYIAVVSGCDQATFLKLVGSHYSTGHENGRAPVTETVSAYIDAMRESGPSEAPNTNVTTAWPATSAARDERLLRWLLAGGKSDS